MQHDAGRQPERPHGALGRRILVQGGAAVCRRPGAVQAAPGVCDLVLRIRAQVDLPAGEGDGAAARYREGAGAWGRGG